MVGTIFATLACRCAGWVSVSQSTLLGYLTQFCAKMERKIFFMGNFCRRLVAWCRFVSCQKFNSFLPWQECSLNIFWMRWWHNFLIGWHKYFLFDYIFRWRLWRMSLGKYFLKFLEFLEFFEKFFRKVLRLWCKWK